jgi:hypothetical protein
VRRATSWWAVALAVARRPRLWGVAVRQSARLAGPGWWRHRPWLPLPAGDYLRFRLETQYGDPDAAPSAEDVLNYLAWCHQWGE